MPLLRAEVLRKQQLLYPNLKHDPSQVLYLPFDKDDGSYARDRSGYNNHGTVYGATRVAGKVGGGLSFDGVNDYVSVPHSDSLYLSGDFTVLVWATLERTPIDWCGVIDKGRGTRNDFWLLTRRGYSQFLFGIGFTDGTISEQASPLVSLGEWNFYAFGVEGSNQFISLNGAAKTFRAFTKTRNIGTQRLTLGCKNDLTLYERVKLDEVRIYSKALSVEEIRRLMYMRGL